MNEGSKNDVTLRMQYAGAIGLLCEISTSITDEFDKESLINCVADWCRYSGWTMRVILDRVEVEPPDEIGGGA